MADAYTSQNTKYLYRGMQIVWYLVGIIEVILAFRFVLKFLEPIQLQLSRKLSTE